MSVNLLTIVHPAYSRSVDLSVTRVDNDNLRYSVEVPQQRPSADEFTMVAARAESALTVSVIVASERPHRVRQHHSLGSNRLTEALRAQDQPVGYITIQPTGLGTVSYSAPEQRLEWECAQVRAYDGAGQELASVSDTIGWLNHNGLVFLADPPQPARI